MVESKTLILFEFRLDSLIIGSTSHYLVACSVLLPTRQWLGAAHRQEVVWRLRRELTDRHLCRRQRGVHLLLHQRQQGQLHRNEKLVVIVMAERTANGMAMAIAPSPNSSLFSSPSPPPPLGIEISPTENAAAPKAASIAGTAALAIGMLFYTFVWYVLSKWPCVRTWIEHNGAVALLTEMMYRYIGLIKSVHNLSYNNVPSVAGLLLLINVM